MKIEILSKTEDLTTEKTIISKIRDLINEKNLEPGDKLPSERNLAEKFEVSRNSIREAIQKLEFYGLLRSMPQSGTFVANIGVIALNGMIEDILRLDKPDFKALVETRILLELKAVKLAALRRTEEDLIRIKQALDAHAVKVREGESAVQEDLLFHLAIANASQNSSLNTFMLVITPEIITNFQEHHICKDDRSFKVIEDHEAIYLAIKNQNSKMAKQKMKDHFSELYEYCYNL